MSEHDAKHLFCTSLNRCEIKSNDSQVVICKFGDCRTCVFALTYQLLDYTGQIAEKLMEDMRK